jgi:hypothetical protein
MTNEQRQNLAEAIAERYLECFDMKDLERFFFDTQLDCLLAYTDTDLQAEAEDYFSAEEVEELMSKTIAA